MPPPQDHQAPSGGFRIAGAASRAASASASASSVPPSSSPAPSAQPPKEDKPPTKLTRNLHTAHHLPSKPAPPKGGHGPSRPWPQRPQAPQQCSSGSSTATVIAAVASHGNDDEEEEGAIDDSAPFKPTSSSSGFKPPPPKTPPHPSSSFGNTRRPSHGQGNDSRDRRRDQYQSYQPRSPSPQRGQPTTSSQPQASHLKSPSPAGEDRRSSREYDNGALDQRNHRQQYSDRHGGNGVSSRPQHRTGEEGSAREWDRSKEPSQGWDNDRRADRGWENDRRGDRGWDRDSNRRLDIAERDRPSENSRYPHHRDGQRERGHDRNVRDRELSPPPTGRGGGEGRFAGWSPTPPGSQTANSTANGHGETFAHRPPSRMGRAEPPPPLSRPEHPLPSAPIRDPESTLKRPRSPGTAGRRSPPAGLLKRKANFPAVVPPTLVSPPKPSSASDDNVAPGAPIPPKINTLESPTLPSNPTVTLPGGSHPGSTAPSLTVTPSLSTTNPTIPADANFTITCDALDDLSVPFVRLSCLPRKLPHTAPLSGRERRKTRGPAVPLNQRKFVGCSSLDDYEISIKLGQGTFGEVLKGRQILTGTQVALKKVTIHDAKDGLPITALREIKLLKKLKHPSIVPVIDMAYRPSGERGKLGDVYMVEPYMDHDLNGMLENPSIRLENSQIKLYMKQLLEGTLYLHKNRILHRDMKAANLLINNKGQLQIADFGLARPYRDPGQSWTGKGWTGGTHRYTNMVVTRWYRPPELLAGEKKYGPPIDMWGIGCILAEMVMGKPLFKGTSEINQLELIAQLCGSPNETTFPGWSSLPGVKDADPTGRPDPHPEIPGQHEFGNHPRRVKDQFRNVYDAGPGCADLIDKLLVLDPKKRLTAQQALEHEWFWTKPFPADPGSLPKYEHSKEIDQVKREWKPAPAPVAVPVVMPVQPTIGGGGSGGMMGNAPGMMGNGIRPQQAPYLPGPQGGQQQQQQQRPYGRGPYQPQPQPNGGGSIQPNPTDGWEGPPSTAIAHGYGQQPIQRPPLGAGYNSRPYPAGPSSGSGVGGGGGRYAFPGGQQPHGGGGRFPHPNARGPPAHHQQQQGGGLPQHPRAMQHGLPVRPPVARPGAGAGSSTGGGGGGGGQNP